jgi:hypothetical protein
MNDIIKLAQEAGLYIATDRQWMPIIGLEYAERFAALIAAQEREACAQVCEARFMGDLNREDQEARRCADAIRKRGEK